MIDSKPRRPARPDTEGLTARVGERAARKENRRGRGDKPAWFGLGMFGLIGWSVAVPTMLGIALGVWLDERFAAETVSWTITFLFIGVVLVCANAWYWLAQERDEND